ETAPREVYGRHFQRVGSGGNNPGRGSAAAGWGFGDAGAGCADAGCADAGRGSADVAGSAPGRGSGFIGAAILPSATLASSSCSALAGSISPQPKRSSRASPPSLRALAVITSRIVAA